MSKCITGKNILVGCSHVGKKRHSLCDLLIDRVVSEIEENDYPTESKYKNTLVISRLKQVVKGNSWIQDIEKRFYNFIKKIVI